MLAWGANDARRLEHRHSVTARRDYTDLGLCGLSCGLRLKLSGSWAGGDVVQRWGSASGSSGTLLRRFLVQSVGGFYSPVRQVRYVLPESTLFSLSVQTL